MMRERLGLRRTLVVALVACVVGGGAMAQSLPQKPRVMPGPPASHGADSYFNRQFAQIDQLIRLEHLSRANALLEQLASSGAPEDPVRKRRIRIALAVGDHERAADLCRDALAIADDDPEIWRQYAATQVALDQHDAARQSLDHFLDIIREPRAGFAIAVDILSRGTHPRAVIALIDSARVVVGDPSLLARARARQLLFVDRPEAAADEVHTELQASSFNLPLLRQDLLGEDAPPLSAGFTARLLDLADRSDAIPELAILAANVLLAAGDAAAAIDIVKPLLAHPVASSSVLANATILVVELPVLPQGREQVAQTNYLLDILPVLGDSVQKSTHLRYQALGALAGVCTFALQNGLLDADPVAAERRFASLLNQVRRGHPESEQLYVAQIELARFTRDRLRDPTAAARRLEALLLDLDLPLPGVALARLALGETYLAARDTARARQVLTALGRDPQFREPAGHAHFFLAKLDLAQGHLATARDRFAAVALDSPAAPYANDALRMGLIVAEELQNPTGGPDLLLRYSRSVWWHLAAEPDSQRVALHRYIDRAAQQVDIGEAQPLLEYARYELAALARTAGRIDEALNQLERIIIDQPDGRLAAHALSLRGEMMAVDKLDYAAARREYDRLLAQYPDHLFAAEIRRRMRELP